MKKILIALIALIIAEGFVYCVLNYRSVTVGQMPSSIASTTVLGTFICLPHKGNGPSTMECAYGMKGVDGSNYALDWSGSPTSAQDLPMDRKFSVTGMFVPVEALNTDHWQVYDIKGIIKVDSYRELAEGVPVMQVGKATLELLKSVKFGDVTIRVNAVTEDSRCPSDVTCIQAGRVKVAVILGSISSPSRSSTLMPGETATLGAVSFKLDKVTPYPVSTHKTADNEYRFEFTVKNK